MRIRISLIALASASTMASASDLPARTAPLAPAPAPLFTAMPMDWNGGYVGATVSARRLTRAPSPLTAAYELPDDGAGANNPLATQINTLGVPAAGKARTPFGAGLFGGYNMQSGIYVYGVEADANYTLDRAAAAANGVLGVTGTYTDNNVGAGDTTAASGTLTNSRRSRLNWDGSLRLRAGVLAIPSMLIYATGGLAVGRVSTATSLSGVVTFVNETPAAQATHTFDSVARSSAFRLGWTLGGGVDYRLTDNLTLRAEYRYTDLGRKSASNATTPVCAPAGAVCTALAANPATVTNSHRDAFHAVKIGLAYQFGAGFSPTTILARY
ncbi:MAG: porin family protein [Hyphomicrobiales bacterium]|nr:porin family protein [Hyphomicrobiales bacterium]